MRFGASIFGSTAILLVMSFGGFVPTSRGQGLQRSTRSAGSSETNSLEIFKNLNRLDDKDDGSKKLEDELSKSLAPFANAHSFETIAPSTYQVPRMPVMKSHRSKEDLEEAKGWFWNAEEVMSDEEGSDSALSDSALFPGLSSGSGASKRAGAWDRLSSRGSPDVSGKSFSSDQPSSHRDTSSDDDDAALPAGIREVAKSLKGRLEGESVGSIFNPSTTRSSVSDFFGQPLDSGPSPAQIEAQKSYMREYQSIIGGGQVLSSPADMGFLKSVASPTLPGTAGGLDRLPGSSRRDLLSSSPGNAPSVLLPATLPDVNANVLNQWNPLYTPVAPEAPKPAPFFPPPLEIPRRKF